MRRGRGLRFPDPKKKVSKYRNIRTESSGIVFDSGAEARRYEELKLLERIGEVSELHRQVEFPIVVNGIEVCKYRADFCYKEKVAGRWEGVVEDKKGVKTKDYIIKKKLMLAVHGIDIRET